MTLTLGILFSALWLVYIGQVVSVVNPQMAQRLRLQERDSQSDPLFRGLEHWTAGWDLLTLWVLPSAGILLLTDHPFWPYAAMIGGAIYLDAGGREAAKIFGERDEGVRTGTVGEQRLMMATYAVFAIIGAVAIVSGLMAVI